MGYHGKYAVIIVLVFLVFLLYFFPSTSENIYSETDFFMDTAVTIKVVGDAEVINNTFKVMKEWAERLDRFNDSSLISYIVGKGQWVEVDPEIFNLLQEVKEYASLTRGAFDPTISPLIDLWGFGEGEEHLPDEDEIRGVLSRINYKRLKLDPVDNRVFLPSDMGLDLGGAAKGFIVDKGIEFLTAAGIESAYINAGGNIRVVGNKPGGHPWKIGIRKPREENQVYRDFITGLSQGSLATSGDYERYFIVNGLRYSHLLDPRTGYPARKMQSATIYARNGLTADILSTAVFVLGWEEGRKLIENIPDVEGFLVRKDGRWYSDGFLRLIKGAEQNF